MKYLKVACIVSANKLELLLSTLLLLAAHLMFIAFF